MEDKIKDLTNFNEIAFLRGDAAYKRYVDSIFHSKRILQPQRLEVKPVEK